mmetsp:Transcript_27527/g.49633  ORF Transcript_27527/g.49633 Transcript_27527/m.49633 type:complete len:431 (+) Transcript_27527:478-1770(+)
MYSTSYWRSQGTQQRGVASRGVPNTSVSGSQIARSRAPLREAPKPSSIGNLSGYSITTQNQTSTQSTRPASGTNEAQHRRSPAQDKGRADDNEIITIHVCDENRKVNKDFKCAKRLLVTQMKFFELHLSGSGSFEDIDISVHCDVGVFESLMQFLHEGSSDNILEVSNVISILISSEYLQMDRLVDNCLHFIVDHINEVVNLSIDMSCISVKLMRRLAGLIDVQKLDEISDKRDKLLSRIYTNKVETMLDDENNHLSRCIYCDKLFSESQRSELICDKADIFIDIHGNVLAEHVADRNWDFKKFVSYLNSQAFSWSDIYWKIWSRLITFDCVDCGKCFQGAELEHCSYHPLKAKFTIGSNIGTYQCCQQQAVHLDASIQKQGCTARRHSVKPDQSRTPEYEILIKRLPTTTEPVLEESSISKYVEQFVAV